MPFSLCIHTNTHSAAATTGIIVIINNANVIHRHVVFLIILKPVVDGPKVLCTCISRFVAMTAMQRLVA